MLNMKSLSLTVQKLWLRLKLTTDRQTNKQTDRTKKYAIDHSNDLGHKNKGEIASFTQNCFKIILLHTGYGSFDVLTVM